MLEQDNTRIKVPGNITGPGLINGKSVRAAGAGIQVIWGPVEYDGNPQVKSIQGVYRWSQIEAKEGVYDWRQLHADLKRSHDFNKPIMVQLNMPAPDWLSKYVAVLGQSRGGNAYQYWDPIYVHHHKMILQSFAGEIKKSEYANMVIGIRVQPNAYNTEYFIFEPTEFDGKIPVENDRKTWQSVPADGAYIYNRTDIAPGTADNFGVWYMKQVQAWYIEIFQTIGVKTAFRTLLNEKHISQPDYINSIFATSGAMCLDTRCGMNAADGMRSRYALLRKRCREGNLLGYWEDSQYEWAGHTWQQNMYWRNMLRLDAGISYPAVYGAHMEYDSSFAFTNKYAGFYNLPTKTPGSWIIFCRNRVVENNMGYFITLTNPQDVTYIEDFNLKAKEGAFAMKINSGGSINLTIDNAFYETVKNQNVQVSITYYSQPGISFQLIGQSIVTGDNSNSYKTVNYIIPATQTLDIKAIIGNPVIHKIEIERTTY